jgi:GT2 family glycosyltransferase
MSTPRVSVVIPVYNAGPLLAEALRSLDAQAFRDFETVIVDDGSTEPRTLAILARATRAPGVTVHRVPNGGPARARNLAIERARGEFILPLDADDYLAPAFLERTVPVLDAEPDVGIVHTWVGLVGGHRGTWRTGGFTVDELLSRCTIHVTSLFRRAVWEQVGGYDPRFVHGSEDWDFWIGAAAAGWTARAVPEVLAFYRRSASSRERDARRRGVSAKCMRALVRKHRALYDGHMEAALAGMYERLCGIGVMLERIYHHPAARLAVRLRGLLRSAAA